MSPTRKTSACLPCLFKFEAHLSSRRCCFCPIIDKSCQHLYWIVFREEKYVSLKFSPSVIERGGLCRSQIILSNLQAFIESAGNSTYDVRIVCIAPLVALKSFFEVCTFGFVEQGFQILFFHVSLFLFSTLHGRAIIGYKNGICRSKGYILHGGENLLCFCFKFIFPC